MNFAHDPSPPAATASGEAASLTGIKVRRAARSAPVSKKSGDLTQRLRAPATPPVSAPPPPSPAAQPVAAPVAPAPPVARAPAPPPTPIRPIAAPERPRPSAPRPSASPIAAALQDERVLRQLWEHLRGRSDLPPIAALDARQVATSWPNTLLVNYSGGGMPQITRLGRHTDDVEYTSMVTEWILSCSREIARLGKPAEKEERFPGEHRRRNYHMLLLPFASAAGQSDQILCHLTCLD